MPKDTVVTAKVPANEKTGQEEKVASITVQSTDDLEEAVEMWGPQAILSNAFANWRVTLQGNIRSGLKKGESQESLQARLGGAKMGVATAGAQVNPEDAYLAMFASATPEKQKEMLEQLKDKAAG